MDSLEQPKPPEALEVARQEIMKIDEELVAILEKRFGKVREVAQIKIAHGIPVLDPSQEGKVRTRVRNKATGDLVPDAADYIFQAIMEKSREFQEKIIAENK